MFVRDAFLLMHAFVRTPVDNNIVLPRTRSHSHTLRRHSHTLHVATESDRTLQSLVSLSQKICSPENFGPRTIFSQKIGLGGPIFLKKLVRPVV